MNILLTFKQKIKIPISIWLLKQIWFHTMLLAKSLQDTRLLVNVK